MTAILTNYWTQTLALIGAFVLLGIKLATGKQDTTVDAVVWALIAYAFGARTAEKAAETKAEKVAEKVAEKEAAASGQGGTNVP